MQHIIITSIPACRYQQIQVQALATASSGGRSVSDMDVSGLVSFVTSTPRLTVDSSGVVAVASRSGAGQGRVSLVEHVSGTQMKVVPLNVEISEDHVCSNRTFTIYTWRSVQSVLDKKMHQTMLQMCAAPICAAHHTSQVQILASVPSSCIWHA